METHLSRYTCVLTNGRDVHEYYTRGRDILRAHQHRRALYKQLKSQVGVKIIHHLPRRFRDPVNPEHMKSQLKQLSLTFDLYSVGESMATHGGGGGI